MKTIVALVVLFFLCVSVQARNSSDFGNQCVYSISPGSASFQSNGGAGSFNITTSAGCAWTATSNVFWISIAGASSGTGSATVQYSVQQNFTLARTGIITVGGQTYTINQAGQCSYSLTPTGATVSSNGGNFTFNVLTQPGCVWDVRSSFDWITVTTPSGAGNGTVGYSVAPNTGALRSGMILFMNRPIFPVHQLAGASCSYSLSLPSTTIPASGGTGFFTLNTQSGCVWTAQSSAPWLAITSSSNGTGSGSVEFSAQPNTTGQARTGSINVGGLTFTVTQSADCSYSINPATASLPTAGGTGSINVIAGLGCVWNAVSNETWISIGNANGTGNGVAQYSVGPNGGAARTGTISINGQTFTIFQAGACNYSVPVSSINVASSGGSNSFAINASNGCAWTATASANWITTTNNSGTGSGTIGFNVEANNGAARSAVILAAGLPVAVNQAAGCAFSVATHSANFSANGGNGNFTVTASSAGCSWNAFTNDSWIALSSNSGNGSATVSFTVSPNSGLSRSGTIVVGNQTITVNQEGACTYSLNPNSATIQAAGNSSSFNVATQSGCAWTATANANWITVNNSAGSGSGAVNFTVAANAGSARTATITVNGQIFTVNQTGGCAFSVNPTSANLPASGGFGGFTVNASNPACTWTAQSAASWLTITSGSSGVGNETVNYSVAQNAGQMRTAIISVNGQTFIVNQDSAQQSVITTGALIQTLDGKPVKGAIVSFTNAATGESVSTATNAFGYAWLKIVAGNDYSIAVRHKKHTFPVQSARIFVDGVIVIIRPLQ